MQVGCHASWASEVTKHLFRDRAYSHVHFTLQSTGCLSGEPETESANRASAHLSANPENELGGQSDFPSTSSVHFSTLNGTLAPSYNWQQQLANAITCTAVFPPPPMSARPLHFPSGSTQSVGYRVFRVPRLNFGNVVDLCPQCCEVPFPSVWTMEHLWCANCKFCLPRSIAAQPEILPDPVLTSASAMPLDRPRSPTTTPCDFQNRSKKGKSPRGRRSAKTPSPTMEELRCCPFTSSGNVSLPCLHLNCSPPPNVGLLSRRFEENEKWERARQEAVASFSYENCGCMSAHRLSSRFPSFINQR